MNKNRVKLASRRHADAKAVLESVSVQKGKAGKKSRAARRAAEFVRAFCQAVQRQTYGRISQLVTDCLQAVFEDPYTFDIRIEGKRGKVEAKPVFRRNGEDFDPVTECGGGVVDVAAFALRLAALRTQTVRQVLFLDEPFKHVSREYSPKLAALLYALSTELNIQIVIITHNKDLCCGKVIEVQKEPLPNPSPEKGRKPRSNQGAVPPAKPQVPPRPKSRR